jgi:microcystin-dependent protein
MGENSMSLIDSIYPVGYVYMTISANFNPNTYSAFGNTTWSAVNDSAANISTTGTAGGYVGSNTVTLTTSQMHSHNHGGSGMFAKPGNSTGAQGNTTIRKVYNHIDTTAGTANYGVGTTTFWTSGGGGAHNNMQPYYQVYKWIRTA